MAHRFRRVLGETSLEGKCRFLFGTCLLLLIMGSFWWYGRQTDQLVYEANRREGKLLVDNALFTLHVKEFQERWEIEGIPWVPAELAKALSVQEYEWRVIRPPNEKNLSPPKDEMDRRLVDLWLHAGKKLLADDPSVPKYVDRWVPQDKEYQYYQPLVATTGCLRCHRFLVKNPNPNLAEGDLMAVMQVSFSDDETVDARNWNRAILLATAIITVFMAMVALYGIVRYVIVKPLTHLRDVSDEISRGNTQLRADIHTGDEFEELGEAFNRMLRHLIDAQEELRGLNRNLDSKVDELAQVNMQLYEMNRLKGDFLATVSHELRTPLNAIIGFSDVLSTIDSLTDKQKRYVTLIQRSGRTLLEMINDILDLAKIESGKMDVRLSQFSIDSVIDAQCDMARPLTEKKNIDLECHIQPHLPPLVQDQAKVQQILSNLLSNAIKFTPEGGRITITARREAAQNLVMVVADTGVGIAEEDQRAVFEKFRQGATVRAGGDAMTREYSGTGLGLSIVRELCRLLGGEVSLESDLGKGSTFTVVLPWTRSEQPQLESALADDLEELLKPRPVNFAHQAKPAVSASTSDS